MGPVGIVVAPSVFNSPVSARLKSACKTISGCVATFKNQQKNDWVGRPSSVSCSHLEQLVAELNLLPDIRAAHPPRLPLPDHVYGLVSLDRSPHRVKLAKALLGFHSSFDRARILLQDVVQVLDRPVAATAPQDSFLSGCTRSPPGTKTATMRIRYARIRFSTRCVGAIRKRIPRLGCKARPDLDVLEFLARIRWA